MKSLGCWHQRCLWSAKSFFFWKREGLYSDTSLYSLLHGEKIVFVHSNLDSQMERKGTSDILVLINQDVKYTFKRQSWRKTCLHRNWYELGSDLGKPLIFTGICYCMTISVLGGNSPKDKNECSFCLRKYWHESRNTLEQNRANPGDGSTWAVLVYPSHWSSNTSPGLGAGLGSWEQELACTVSPHPALRQALYTALCSCPLLPGLGWSSFV